MTRRISFIVATLGRPTLAKTLASIETRPGDEILVVGQITPAVEAMDPRPRYIPAPAGRDWGARERMVGIAFAEGTHLAFIDDDDVYAEEAREAMQQAIDATPDRPVIFRMRYPSGRGLWEDQVLRQGNVGTPMMLVPNDSAKLGQWSHRKECDFDFLSSCGWSQAEIVWRRETVALIGHND